MAMISVIDHFQRSSRELFTLTQKRVSWFLRFSFVGFIYSRKSKKII